MSPQRERGKETGHERESNVKGNRVWPSVVLVAKLVYCIHYDYLLLPRVLVKRGIFDLWSDATTVVVADVVFACCCPGGVEAVNELAHELKTRKLSQRHVPFDFPTPLGVRFPSLIRTRNAIYLYSCFFSLVGRRRRLMVRDRIEFDGTRALIAPVV